MAGMDKKPEAQLASGIVPVPDLALAFRVEASVEAPQEVGFTPRGNRRLIPIVSGTARGPRLNGRILPNGVDYQLIVDAGMAEIQARYVIESSDGARIYVENTGIRRAEPSLIEKLRVGEPVDPALVYFRTVPRFETAAPEFAWMMRSIFLCAGARFPDSVVLDIYEVT